MEETETWRLVLDFLAHDMPALAWIAPMILIGALIGGGPLDGGGTGGDAGGGDGC